MGGDFRGCLFPFPSWFLDFLSNTPKKWGFSLCTFPQWWATQFSLRHTIPFTRTLCFCALGKDECDQEKRMSVKIMSNQGQLEGEHFLLFWRAIMWERNCFSCWLDGRIGLRHGPDITSEAEILNLKFDDLKVLLGGILREHLYILWMYLQDFVCTFVFFLGVDSKLSSVSKGVLSSRDMKVFYNSEFLCFL